MDKTTAEQLIAKYMDTGIELAASRLRELTIGDALDVLDEVSATTRKLIVAMNSLNGGTRRHGGAGLRKKKGPCPECGKLCKVGQGLHVHARRAHGKSLEDLQTEAGR